MSMVIHKAHPWHGINPGSDLREKMTVFIEIVPTDTVKYEVDKPSGYLSIDRPQKYSNIVPALYGFVPGTYCGKTVAELTQQVSGRKDVEGDKDPLDICVLTEKDVTHGDIIVHVRPIGGLRLIDRDQADDKIISVLLNDMIYGNYHDIKELPQEVIDRLVHYFTTYKDLPADKTHRMELIEIYDADKAQEVINCSIDDYNKEIYPYLEDQQR